jgi:hypothetical protein
MDTIGAQISSTKKCNKRKEQTGYPNKFLREIIGGCNPKIGAYVVTLPNVTLFGSNSRRSLADHNCR